MFAAVFFGLLAAAAASPLVVFSNYTLSAARSYLAATSVSNLALFGGGQDNSGRSNVVDVLLSGCLSGFSVNGTGGCEPCPPGFFCPPRILLPPCALCPGLLLSRSLR